MYFPEYVESKSGHTSAEGIGNAMASSACIVLGVAY